MDWSAFALVVSTVAACGAAGFAYFAVRDGRRFHDTQERERQLDQLLAVTRTVSDVADTAVRVGNGAAFEFGLLVARQLRLKVELAALPSIDLPFCQAATTRSAEGEGIHTLGGKVASAAQNALTELEDAVRTLLDDD